MKIINFLLVLILSSGNFLFAQTWDILDKSMAQWNGNGGNINNKAWTTSQAGSGIAITQKTDYVNITKTNAATANNYAFLIPQALTLSVNTAYSIEIKVRTNAIDKVTYPDTDSYFESNQISARLNTKNLAIHLKHGDGDSGYISTVAAKSHEEGDKYKINTSEWHVYRFVFHADNLAYDVYIDDIANPIFENVLTTSMSGSNIIRLGAESQHRCNMDIEYVKMGTGDFYSKSKIFSVVLSSQSQAVTKEKTITATVNTILVNDGEKLLVSLVDDKDNVVVNAVEAIVSQNKAEADLTIPSTVAKGKYFVKATAPNGKIGEVNVNPCMSEYLVTASDFTDKKLITFGNSITAAANSWAYQTHEKLGFEDLYNGAIAGAIWYKRARLAQDGDSIWTQDYFDPNFAGFGNGTNDSREKFQKIINNCAIVHIQKYLIENPDAAPDYAILSYGTNDVASATMGSVEETMSKELGEVNLYTMAGGLRWSLETLQTRFPNLVIYVALPIQAKSAAKNSDNLKKIKVITGICDALSVTYFDCFNESGITVENQAKYLRDGLHPNADGQAVHADYIIRKLDEAVSSTTSVPTIQKDNDSESISISGNVLNAGQSLLVKSLNYNILLAELTLYNVAGNEVYRKPVSGSEFTLQAPSTCGVYIMVVKLNNNTSQTFKILVK